MDYSDVCEIIFMQFLTHLLSCFEYRLRLYFSSVVLLFFLVFFVMFTSTLALLCHSTSQDCDRAMMIYES
jgi:hypothetical protein